LDQAESDWRGAQNAAAEASQRLGGAPDSMVTLDLQDADRLFDFLREAEDQSAQLKRVEKQIEELHTNEESDGRVTTTQLQRGIDELRLWLRSPDPVRVAAATAPSDQPAWIPILCLVLVLIGFALGYFVHPALFAIAGLGIGWMLPRTARNSDAERTQDSTENARAKAEAQFDLEAPAAWTEPEVAKHLRQIEDRLVELLLADRQSNSTKERLRSLQVEQDSLLKFNGTLSERRTDLAKQLGLQQIPPDAQLVNMARSMDQLRKAQQAELAAAGKLESIRAQQADLLARLADSLSPIAKTAPKDAASAHAIVESLAQRNADLRSALHDQKQATERIQSLEKECQTLTDRSQSILQNAGVADRSEFDALISHLGAYRSDLEKHRDLLTAIQRVETKLRAAGEESLLEMALEPLNAESKRAQESADSLEALSQQKAEIQGKIERAREDHEIEEGLSLKDEILAELESLRDDALFGAAGQFLLNTVTKEHAYESMPKVFEDARRLFADFTQQRYNLHVHDEHEQSFFAVETATKQRRNLDELSDGTRIQLALAARLAFVKQAEQGTPLPLFLDEALDHSDSERFHAIASSLAKMVVDEGRQIFYLTSDPTDIERLQRAFSECGAGQVHEINLAVARGQGTKIETAEQLTIAPLAQVPEPGSLSAEQYGARIKVPQFDPRKGAAGTHLFYLLSDDLEALHRLLNLPIESAGQWLNLNDVKAHVATALVDQSPTIAELASRIALLDEFCEQRLIGRGKPLDLAVLEASEALTANSLEKVPQLARDLENDASALIEVLRNRGPHELAKGFPRKQTEALEAYLLEEGFIDPRSPRSESELNDRVLTIPAAAKLPANSRRDLLHMWWSLTEAESADRPA
jgi:energy-coupling factor transporter ATP-binding protein EcfA2